MELQLGKRKQLKVIWEDKEYLLDKPQISAALGLEVAMAACAAEGKPQADAVIDFVVGCGMPREVVLSLDAEAFAALVEALSPKKKS